MFLEVTNRCNLQCKTCPRTFVAYEPPSTLTWDSFVSVVEQFPSLERAVLHGIGEPLLNSALPRMIEHLKQSGVTVLFNTNAVLLDKAWSQRLISSGLDEMRISIDSADPATYARIRGIPLLPRVVDNLKAFTELQRELNVDRPRVSIWMTGMRENIAELPALVRLAAEAKVPEVYLQRIVYYLDAENPPGFLDGSRALFGDFDERVESIVAGAEDLARRLGITLKASGATDPRGSLSRARARESSPWSPCLRPWTTAYVTANGNCLPCCIGPFATTDYDSLKMGNLFDRDFASIWNGDEYRAWRMALLSEHPPVPCRGCGVSWSL